MSVLRQYKRKETRRSSEPCLCVFGRPCTNRGPIVCENVSRVYWSKQALEGPNPYIPVHTHAIKDASLKFLAVLVPLESQRTALCYSLFSRKAQAPCKERVQINQLFCPAHLKCKRSMFNLQHYDEFTHNSPKPGLKI